MYNAANRPPAGPRGPHKHGGHAYVAGGLPQRGALATFTDRVSFEQAIGGRRELGEGGAEHLRLRARLLGRGGRLLRRRGRLLGRPRSRWRFRSSRQRSVRSRRSCLRSRRTPADRPAGAPAARGRRRGRSRAGSHRRARRSWSPIRRTPRRACGLFGHDREPAAVLAGARGLDRGIVRQQVRLVRDPRDRLADPVDLVRLAGELVDPGMRLLPRDPDALHHAVRLARRLDALLAQLLRAVRGGRHRGRQLATPLGISAWRSAPWATSELAAAMPVIACVVCSTLSRTCPNTSLMSPEESMNRRSDRALSP